jgi:Putative Actinobacterial Holin-X, holin superfamily III
MLTRSERFAVPEEDGIGDLVHRLVDEGKTYAKAEINVYKTIGTEKARSFVTPVILIVAAIILAHAAFLALVATVFVFLAALLKSDTLGGLVTVLILAGLAGTLGYVGYSKLSGGSSKKVTS